jgi:hypothetical protein
MGNILPLAGFSLLLLGLVVLASFLFRAFRALDRFYQFTNPDLGACLGQASSRGTPTRGSRRPARQRKGNLLKILASTGRGAQQMAREAAVNSHYLRCRLAIMLQSPLTTPMPLILRITGYKF